jgi:hypothetical protein
LKRVVFVSVVDLQAAIDRFVVEHNIKPKPFTWTADPDKIIRAVRRGHQVSDSHHWKIVCEEMNEAVHQKLYVSFI